MSWINCSSSAVKVIKTKPKPSDHFAALYDLYQQQQQAIKRSICCILWTNQKIEESMQSDVHVSQTTMISLNQNLISQEHLHLVNGQRIKQLIEIITNKEIESKPTIIMGTLELVNKMLESNYDLEVKLLSLSICVPRVTRLKQFNSELKTYIAKHIQPGAKMNIQEVLAWLYSKRVQQIKIFVMEGIDLQRQMVTQAQTDDDQCYHSDTPHNLFRSKFQFIQRNRYLSSRKVANHPVLSAEEMYRPSISSTEKRSRPQSASSSLQKSPDKRNDKYSKLQYTVNMRPQTKGNISLNNPQQVPRFLREPTTTIRQSTKNSESKRHDYTTIVNNSLSRKLLTKPPKAPNTQTASELKKLSSDTMKRKELYAQLIANNLHIRESQSRYYLDFKNFYSNKFNDVVPQPTISFDTLDSSWKPLDQVKSSWNQFQRENDIKLKALVHDNQSLFY